MTRPTWDSVPLSAAETTIIDLTRRLEAERSAKRSLRSQTRRFALALRSITDGNAAEDTLRTLSEDQARELAKLGAEKARLEQRVAILEARVSALLGSASTDRPTAGALEAS